MVIDDGIDERARRLRLGIDFGALSLVHLLAQLVARLIGRLLHPGDHHAADRERPLKRKHGDPRQMRVGRNVSCRQLIEQTADPAHHGHRQ